MADNPFSSGGQWTWERCAHATQDPHWCWRCEARGVKLYHDPFAAGNDPIGICRDCVSARSNLKLRNPKRFGR